MAKKITNETLIHIKAVSPIYSVYEITPESKAVKTLESIRDNFVRQNSRHKNVHTLSVSTCVHNPTLFK